MIRSCTCSATPSTTASSRPRSGRRAASRRRARSGSRRRQRGGIIEIDLRDDGAGLDPARLRASAVQKGAADRGAGGRAGRCRRHRPDLSARLLHQRRPSPRSPAGASGMDVVREHLERLNGQRRGRQRARAGHPLHDAGAADAGDQPGPPGRAGRAALRHPVGVGRADRARPRPSALVSLEGRRAVTIEGHPVPVGGAWRDVLERPAAGPTPSRDDLATLPGAAPGRAAGRPAGGPAGSASKSIVVKSLGWPLRRVRNVGGATVLGSGEVVVILNPTDLLQDGLRRPAGAPARRRDRGAARATAAARCWSSTTR